MPAPTHPAFSVVAPHYDSLMRGVPYAGWVHYLDQLLEHHLLKPQRVLDLACGTGNVSEILARRGYDVVGVDLSEPMIERARAKATRHGLCIDYYVQDAASMDVPAPFDLCVSLFDSLNYIIEPTALAAAIQRVYAHLRPGGLFVFDVNSVFALENGFFDQDNLMARDRLRYVWRSTYDPASRLCTVDMRFFLRGRDGVDKEFRETHVQFAYGEEDLRQMLADAGFAGSVSYHAYTMLPVRPTSDRIFFVARRPY